MSDAKHPRDERWSSKSKSNVKITGADACLNRLLLERGVDAYGLQQCLGRGNRNTTSCQVQTMAKKRTVKADLVAIGRRIRQLRGGIRQEELAEYLGISQGQLSKIERGRLTPSVEVLLRLSERFSKSIDWIPGGWN